MKNEIVEKLDQLTIACAEIELREYRKEALSILNELRRMIGNLISDKVVSKTMPVVTEHAEVPIPYMPQTKLVSQENVTLCTSIPPPKVEKPKSRLYPMRKFKLSHRTSNCLKLAKLYYVEDVVSKTEDELLLIKNFGRTCLTELEKVLSENGLELKA